MFLANKLNKGSGAAASTTDSQFNYVTMLLHGDGTNGTQNNTFLDSSTNNFTITRNGNTTQGSFSPYGSNWSFNNPDSNGGISIPTSTALDLGTGDFTIEAWVNTSKLPTTNAFQTSSGGYQNIFGTGPDNSPTGTGMYIGVTNLKFDLVSDGNGPIDVAHNMVAGVWYHIAVSRSGNTFRAFINGSLVQTNTSSSSANNGYGWGIMRSERIGGYDGAWWYGYISNFRVVKGTALYTSGFTPPTSPLTAISGTGVLTCQSNCFIDTSSTAATVTVAGSTSVQRFNPFGASTAYSTSVIGGSGYFDGSGDYLTASNNSVFAVGTGNFTVEAWVYPLAFSSYRAVFDTRTTLSNGGMDLGLANSSAGVWGLYKGAGVTVVQSSTNLKLNAWQHIAAVRSGSTVTLYLNGVSVGSATDAQNFSEQGCNIGRTFDGYVWNGYITDLRFNSSAVYTSAFTPPSAPLSAITNTQLLLNTTNGAIFDNAMMNDLETVGNAQISTSVKKYGTGSLAFDGTGDWIAAPARPSLALGNAPFTLEAWIYPTTLSNTKPILESRSSPSSANGYAWLVNSSGYLNVYTNGAFLGASSSALTANVWTHVALVRTGTGTNQTTYYIDGVASGTITMSGNFTDAITLETKIGGSTSSGEVWIGYMDDLRITNGYARYTANFTPPSAAFPNTGPI